VTVEVRPCLGRAFGDCRQGRRYRCRGSVLGAITEATQGKACAGQGSDTAACPGEAPEPPKPPKMQPAALEREPSPRKRWATAAMAMATATVPVQPQSKYAVTRRAKISRRDRAFAGKRRGLRPPRPGPEARCAGAGRRRAVGSGCDCSSSAARPRAEAQDASGAASADRSAGRYARGAVRMTRLRQTISKRLKEAQDTAAMLTTFNRRGHERGDATQARIPRDFREEARGEARLMGSSSRPACRR